MTTISKILFLLSLFMIAFLSIFYNPTPSDHTMSDQFYSKVADFNKLLAMVMEDDLDSITPNKVYKKQADKKNLRLQVELAPERMEEYRRLLQKTGIQQIFNDENDRYVFGFWKGVYDMGLRTSHSKSFVYLETPPKNLFNSLDEAKKLPNNSMSYKKISDNWYLEYQKFE